MIIELWHALGTMAAIYVAGYGLAQMLEWHPRCWSTGHDARIHDDGAHYTCRRCRRTGMVIEL